MSSLSGRTVVVLGGSSGLGLAAAQLARAEGADVVVTGRDPVRLDAAARASGAVDSAAFDAADPEALAAFFQGRPAPVDHVFVSAGGPYYAALADVDFAEAHGDVDRTLWLALHLGRAAAAGGVRAGGSLTFMSGTGGRRASTGFGLIAPLTAAIPALARVLAVELAPTRVNVVAAGFVDTPLSARLLDDALDDRRDELRRTLPIARVVQPEDVAALVVHLMTNTALTGATYDVDGGQQLV